MEMIYKIVKARNYVFFKSYYEKTAKIKLATVFIIMIKNMITKKKLISIRLSIQLP
jgi:hypothetical protein